jgi:hypothetical protein
VAAPPPRQHCRTHNDRCEHRACACRVQQGDGRHPRQGLQGGCVTAQLVIWQQQSVVQLVTCQQLEHRVIERAHAVSQHTAIGRRDHCPAAKNCLHITLGCVTAGQCDPTYRATAAAQVKRSRVWVQDNLHGQTQPAHGRGVETTNRHMRHALPPVVVTTHHLRHPPGQFVVDGPLSRCAIGVTVTRPS